MSRAALRHIVLPVTCLAVALLGGLRFVPPDLEMRFVAPPLTTLLLGTLLAIVFSRAGLVDLGRDWLGSDRPVLENASNGFTLLALFAATVQILNCVLPEDTLFYAVFAVTFALILWNNLFVVARPDALVKSIGGLLLAAFAMKYLLLAALFEPGESFARSLVQMLLKGISLGSIEGIAYARATGYTAFLAVVLYVMALWMASPPRDSRMDELYEALARASRLPAADRDRLLDALQRRERISEHVDDVETES